MTTTETTDIVPIRMDAQLTRPSVILSLPEDVIVAIGNAFPDPGLSIEQRARQTHTLLHQFKLYIETAQNKQKESLQRCVLESLAECAIGLASLDLPLTKALNYAAIVPYNGIATIMLQYQGLGELMMRPGTIGSIQTGVVYKGQEFDYDLGSEPFLTCKMFDGEQRDDDITHAWCVVHNIHGPKSIEVCTRQDIDKIRRASKMPNGPTWTNWFDQMARKCPMRRIAKWMRTCVSGPGMVTLDRGLALENSQYDPDRIKHFRKVSDDYSKEAVGKVMDSLDAPKAPQPSGLATAKKALLAKVAKARKGIASSLSDGGFVVEVAKATYDGRTTLNTVAECQEIGKVFTAFDLDTCERIPDA